MCVCVFFFFSITRWTLYRLFCVFGRASGTTGNNNHNHLVGRAGAGWSQRERVTDGTNDNDFFLRLVRAVEHDTVVRSVHVTAMTMSPYLGRVA